MTAFVVLLAFVAPLLQSIGLLQDPSEFLNNPAQQPPSAAHWFGTTRLGYDVFSRTIFGIPAALQVVVLSTVLSVLVGVPLGMVSGYLGGKFDRAILFVMDTIYTLPSLLLSVTLSFVLGRGVLNAAIEIGRASCRERVLNLV